RPVELDQRAVCEAMAHPQALRAEPGRRASDRPRGCPETPSEFVRIDPATVGPGDEVLEPERVSAAKNEHQRLGALLRTRDAGEQGHEYQGRQSHAAHP